MFQDNKKMGVFLFILVLFIVSIFAYYSYTHFLDKKIQPSTPPEFSKEDRTAIINEFNTSSSTQISPEQRKQTIKEFNTQQSEQPKTLTAEDKKAILDSFN